MARRSGRKRPSAARRVAEAAADVAIGGTALAADKAIEAVDEIVERAGSVARRGRRGARGAGERAARTARRAAGRGDGRSYEERSREELYTLATERGIEGRSSMRKTELIAALRAGR
jgi:hypothetical protein